MFSLVAGALTSQTSLAQLPKMDPPRAWTMAAGQTFNASLLEFDGTTAIFKMPNGARTQALKTALSDADQKYLDQWQAKQPLKFTMPDDVAVDAAHIKAEVVSEDEANEKFVYRTDHFEFTTQGKFTLSLLREVGRTFEATYELLRQLPWGIDPHPPGGDYFKASLLKTQDEYLRAGGVPNSAGIYISGKQTFFAPFSSLGLKPSGKSFTKAGDYTADTVVHELTHELMHQWLNYLPNWIVEGTAEYTGNLPLKLGRFHVASAKTGLKDYIDFLKHRAVGGMPEPYPIDKLFKITNREWGETLAQDPTASHRMYFTSYLLVYYFMHLDGGGGAQRFVRFFREVDKVRKTGRYLNDAQKAKFDEDMLNILLDGRTQEELMKQIRQSYQRFGIRL
jgi:hypothetical protein